MIIRVPNEQPLEFWDKLAGVEHQTMPIQEVAKIIRYYAKRIGHIQRKINERNQHINMLKADLEFMRARVMKCEKIRGEQDGLIAENLRLRRLLCEAGDSNRLHEDIETLDIEKAMNSVEEG